MKYSSSCVRGSDFGISRIGFFCHYGSQFLWFAPVVAGRYLQNMCSPLGECLVPLRSRLQKEVWLE